MGQNDQSIPLATGTGIERVVSPGGGSIHLHVVDTVDFGKKAGHIYKIEAEQIPALLRTGFSVHHVGLSDLLLASKMMGIIPDAVCLIGIQPGCVDFELEMTEAVRLRREDLIDLILRKLQQWGVTCALQSL